MVTWAVYATLHTNMKQSTAEVRHDIFTIPNAITIGRLAVSPVVAWRLARNPAKRWPEAMLFAASDNVDGALARLGDKYPKLQPLGFRRSEIGRKADPFVDKVFTTEMIAAGYVGGALASAPAKALAVASLAQKATVGAQTWRHEREGIELEVRQSGKYFEFANNLGFGMQFIAESITDPRRKQLVQRLGLGLAAIGIGGAFINNFRYGIEADQLRRQTHEQLPPADSHAVE